MFSAAKASVSVSTSGFASTLFVPAFVSRLVASATAETSVCCSDFWSFESVGTDSSVAEVAPAGFKGSAFTSESPTFGCSLLLSVIAGADTSALTSVDSVFAFSAFTSVDSAFFSSALTSVESVFASSALTSVESVFASSDLTSVVSVFTSSGLTSGVEVSTFSSEISETAEFATSVDGSVNFSFSTSSAFSAEAAFCAIISEAFTALPLASIKLRVVPKKTDATPTLYFLKENRCCSLLIMW